MFLVTWGTLLPFVLFQALLCARDDYQYDYYGHSRRHAGPSATETVAPLLILLGWLWFVTTAISFSMKTAYQVPMVKNFLMRTYFAKINDYLRTVHSKLGSKGSNSP